MILEILGIVFLIFVGLSISGIIWANVLENIWNKREEILRAK